ncbi:hypothetical protein B0I35DRAFT_125234 [Stachybotrys elegans]|uniref:Zn(2)-C6 fungal-type domain-containing protein n=1 Tax=Stachybotrys elegans TaxID=80388 RepID=A0A8K0T4Q4_9HYPO|nr:hypothetical protein B0I35DRAFT_125234 [Stachybotrys elegans]
MDPGLPDSKRPRLAPWANSSTQGVSLPHPHSSSSQLSHHPPHPAAPAPLSTALPPHTLQHPSGPPHPHAYPPPHHTARHPEHIPAPPAPSHVVPPPPPSQPHLEADRRHHEQEPYAPMQDPYRPQQQHQPPPPPPHHQHQQQHSPSQPHPHYPQYRRDSGVKREPPDDLRRPSSTGHVPEPTIPQQPHPINTSLPPQPGPHSAHPALPSHQMHHQPVQPPYPDNQHRPSMSYDNSHSLPPTPGGYRAPSFPPPPQHQQPQQYEQHPTYQPPQMGETYTYSVYASTTGTKKKNTRASQACDQCRQLKAKCDETKPCKTCRDKGLDCKYRDPVPKAQDKAQTDILEGIQALQTSMATLTGHIAHLDQRLMKMEAFSRPGNFKPEPELDQNLGPEADSESGTLRESISKPVPESVAGPTPKSAMEDEVKYMQSESEPMNGVTEEPLPSPQQQQAHEHDQQLQQAQAQEQQLQEELLQEQQQQYYYPPPRPRPPYPIRKPLYAGDTNREQAEDRPGLMLDDDTEPAPGPLVPPGEPAIPAHHTTTAGLLLEWPAIKELTIHHLNQAGVRYISEYPISQEQRRGLLIVYGRGEDSYPARQLAPAPDHGSVEIADDSSDAASPSPAPDYGQIGLSPSDQMEYKGGVLGVDGNPDFTESKVWTYVQSFKDNMLNMHPIFQPREIDGWVQQFLDRLPVIQPRFHKPQTSAPGFAVSGNQQGASDQTGFKRKRSPFGDGEPLPPPLKAGKPDRSINSALVLLILALGRICLHAECVPDVVHPSEYLPPQGSPQVRNGAPPSPVMGSPPGHQPPSSSPQEQERSAHSRRSSLQGSGSFRSGYSLKKNYEVIPGLEYFAMATDILGNYHGSYNHIKDVWANILASLYHGQLARPMESFAFIFRASHKLEVILRPSLHKMMKVKENHSLIYEHRQNQLALSFWTCLQLESDLIAELHLPSSGLLSYEDGMPPPNMSLLKGFSKSVLDSYPGQLYLRTHLNSIHRMFYAPDDASDLTGLDKFRNVDLVSDAVSGMQWVALSFAFKEDDPPATDILAARLRAKYWGAQVITYRPFIRQILAFSHKIRNSPRSPTLHSRSEFKQGIIAPVINPNAKVVSDIDPGVVELAKKGLKALVESTRAFHGLDCTRPIITNVFGTAHAQWGNLLVLSAAFRDPILHQYVDEPLLRTLFDKTISFLHQSATATSSLRIDKCILEGLRKDLFERGLKPPTMPPALIGSQAAASSTTSSTSTDTAMNSTAAPPPPPPPPPPPSTSTPGSGSISVPVSSPDSGTGLGFAAVTGAVSSHHGPFGGRNPDGRLT